jgi:hypothetical protein
LERICLKGRICLNLWHVLWHHLGTIVQEWSRRSELRKLGCTSAGGVDGGARGAGWFRDRAVFEDLYRGLAGKVGSASPLRSARAGALHLRPELVCASAAFSYQARRLVAGRVVAPASKARLRSKAGRGRVQAVDDPLDDFQYVELARLYMRPRPAPPRPAPPLRARTRFVGDAACPISTG